MYLEAPDNGRRDARARLRPRLKPAPFGRPRPDSGREHFRAGFIEIDAPAGQHPFVRSFVRSQSACHDAMVGRLAMKKERVRNDRCSHPNSLARSAEHGGNAKVPNCCLPRPLLFSLGCCCCRQTLIKSAPPLAATMRA